MLSDKIYQGIFIFFRSYEGKGFKGFFVFEKLILFPSFLRLMNVKGFGLKDQRSS